MASLSPLLNLWSYYWTNYRLKPEKLPEFQAYLTTALQQPNYATPDAASISTKKVCEVEFEGETLYRGWRDKASRPWRMALTSKGSNRITPDTQEEDLQPPDGMAMATI